jgi:hypothetical protein
VNPEESLVGSICSDSHGGTERIFRYSPLSAGLDIVRKTLGHAVPSTSPLADKTAKDFKLAIAALSHTPAHDRSSGHERQRGEKHRFAGQKIIAIGADHRGEGCPKTEVHIVIVAPQAAIHGSINNSSITKPAANMIEYGMDQIAPPT